MDLVNVHGVSIDVFGALLTNPFFVAPLIGPHIPHSGSGSRSELHAESKWIGLYPEFTFCGLNLVFIKLTRLQTRDKQFPYSAISHTSHGKNAPVPVVEISDDAYSFCIRRPYCE